MDNCVYRRSACVTRGRHILTALLGLASFAYRDLYMCSPRCCVSRTCRLQAKKAEKAEKTEKTSRAGEQNGAQDAKKSTENKAHQEKTAPYIYTYGATRPQIRSIRFDQARVCVHPNQGPLGCPFFLSLTASPKVASPTHLNQQHTPASCGGLKSG